VETGLSVTAKLLSLPEAAELAALRAWHEGLSSRDAVARYLGQARSAGQSSRGVIGAIRRDIAAFARSRHRDDLAKLFTGPARKGPAAARAVATAIEQLRSAPVPVPLIGDGVDHWLEPRVAAALRKAGIKTLADLTLRVPRRRRWWVDIDGIGKAGARRIEAFFAAHEDLTDRARALLVTQAPSDVVPWEKLVVPHEVDGTVGLHRAPRASCALRANNDYEAVQAWLSLHEAPATQRAYRKEAERLILWAIVERGVALSSLATEDAVTYRAFLRQPTPRQRWVGPASPRHSAEWRPFAGGLSTRSRAYALSVLSSMFRWLIEQRYVLANPFAGIKVRGARQTTLDTTRSFSEGEWKLVRTVAEGLEWTYGWQPGAAQRLRFLIDFSYSTGLRAGELVHAKLGSIEVDAHGDTWLHVVGKGSKAGKVVLPGLARGVLDRDLAQRGLPVTPAKWNPATPLLGSLDGEGGHHAQAAVGDREEVLRRDGRRLGGYESGVGREAAPGHAALDAAHARHPCTSARRRTDHRARQPAARVLVDHVHVPALGRSSPGQADRWGIRGACGVTGRGRLKRVNLHRKHKGSPRAGFASACRG
jgi:site-specific recombinase XerD